MGTIFLTYKENDEVKVTIRIGKMVDRFVSCREYALEKADKRYDEMMNSKKIAEKL